MLVGVQRIKSVEFWLGDQRRWVFGAGTEGGAALAKGGDDKRLEVEVLEGGGVQFELVRGDRRVKQHMQRSLFSYHEGRKLVFCHR